MNEEQKARMEIAFDALRNKGVTNDEMDKILSEEFLTEVRIGLSQNSKRLAVLVSLAAAAAIAECMKELFEATDRIFLAGWNAHKDLEEEK